MLLRTRISLFATLAFIVICAGFVFVSLQRELIITERFSGEIVSDRAAVWDRIVSNIVQHMKVNARVVQTNEDLIRSVREGDNSGAQQHAGAVFRNLADDGVIDRLDIVLPDGQLIYSSAEELFPSPAIAGNQITAAIAGDRIIGGISNDRERNIVVAVGVPFQDEVGVAGLAIYATDIEVAISELETVTRSTVVLVNRRGRLLAGTSVNLWHELDSAVDLLTADSLQTLPISDHVYSAIVVPQESRLGSLKANLVSIRDVTDVAMQQRRLRNLMVWGTVFALAVVLVLLNVYMSWAFAPLSAGIGMLNSLSRGKLDVRMETGVSRDEVGRIANALNLFRAKLVAMDRLRQSRERQRSRQERFIRREMTGLADTLDDEERSAVLGELEQLEATVQAIAEDTENSFSRAARSLDQLETEDARDGDRNNGGTEQLLREAEPDGLAMMAIAFRKMSDRVQDQNQRLRDSLATRNKLIAIQNELDIAARVQLSLMPDPLPENSVFRISGTMKPAKEVGGDFFDYFRVDQHRIGIVIADVSGKGVPAALFMVMVRTVLRSTIRGHDSPGDVLNRVNDYLEKNNSEQMFVTVFFGVLDERNGRLTFANGGHNAPLLVREGSAEPLPLTGGVVLGMIDCLEYDEFHVDLSPGDRVIFVTDGIAEAFNKDEEAFGDDRLIEVAAESPHKDPDADINEIIARVDEFVGDAPQFDDITCVVLRYDRPLADLTTVEVVSPDEGLRHVPIELEAGLLVASMTSKLMITIDSRLKEIGRVAEIVESHASDRNWPPGWDMKVNVVLDELITNVISYAYEDFVDGDAGETEAGRREIRIELTEAGNELEIVIEDQGKSFDPFSEAPQPDIDASVEDRRIGGLGLYFVKEMMDECSWERRGGINHVRLVKRGLIGFN